MNRIFATIPDSLSIEEIVSHVARSPLLLNAPELEAPLRHAYRVSTARLASQHTRQLSWISGVELVRVGQISAAQAVAL